MNRISLNRNFSRQFIKAQVFLVGLFFSAAIFIQIILVFYLFNSYLIVKNFCFGQDDVQRSPNYHRSLPTSSILHFSFFPLLLFTLAISVTFQTRECSRSGLSSCIVLKDTYPSMFFPCRKRENSPEPVQVIKRLVIFICSCCRPASCYLLGQIITESCFRTQLFFNK